MRPRALIGMLQEIAPGLPARAGARLEYPRRARVGRYHGTMTSAPDDPGLAIGFPPVFDESARILVLGSMPGVRSLEEQHYYAHPRNAFWPIMAALLDFDPDAEYAERLRQLRRRGIALWDVIERCRRRGSLDQRIEPASVVVNDFGGLFERCPRLTRIVFNGRAAEQAWLRHVQPRLEARWHDIERMRMPSTSPAHAALTADRKRDAWAEAISPARA